MQNLLNHEELCKTCGLCCQGVFHSYAYIYNDKDRQFVNDMNADVTFLEEDNLDAFPLPCIAFDTICTSYLNRPTACREHECDLLKNYKNKKITFDKAIDIIVKMQEVLKPLLPLLQEVSNDFVSNNPEFLRKKLLASFPNQALSEEFKNKHQKMLMNYSMFLFFKETYFYIPSDNKIENKY